MEPVQNGGSDGTFYEGPFKYVKFQQNVTLRFVSKIITNKIPE